MKVGAEKTIAYPLFSSPTLLLRPSVFPKWHSSQLCAKWEEVAR